jgi:hypothetical protein
VELGVFAAVALLHSFSGRWVRLLMSVLGQRGHRLGGIQKWQSRGNSLQGPCGSACLSPPDDLPLLELWILRIYRRCVNLGGWHKDTNGQRDFLSPVFHCTLGLPKDIIDTDAACSPFIVKGEQALLLSRYPAYFCESAIRDAYA